jgi:hypothetical protein
VCGCLLPPDRCFLFLSFPQLYAIVIQRNMRRGVEENQRCKFTFVGSVYCLLQVGLPSRLRSEYRAASMSRATSPRSSYLLSLYKQLIGTDAKSVMRSRVRRLLRVVRFE